MLCANFGIVGGFVTPTDKWTEEEAAERSGLMGLAGREVDWGKIHCGCIVPRSWFVGSSSPKKSTTTRRRFVESVVWHCSKGRTDGLDWIWFLRTEHCVENRFIITPRCIGNGHKLEHKFVNLFRTAFDERELLSTSQLPHPSSFVPCHSVPYRPVLCFGSTHHRITGSRTDQSPHWLRL